LLLHDVGYSLCTGVDINFDGVGPKLKKKLWHYFGDVFRWRNFDDVIEMTS